MSLVDPTIPANIFNLYNQILSLQGSVDNMKLQMSNIAKQLSAESGYQQYATPEEQAIVSALIQN